jgi:hypothetical protein
MEVCGQFDTPTVLHSGKRLLRYLLDRRLSGLEIPFGPCGIKKISCFDPKMHLGHPALSLVSMPTELFLLA